jgi:hypothetical protein
VAYIEENGFAVTITDVQDMAPIKEKYQIPQELQSCHTAIVDGYVIEGHVPVREINRLLAERPDFIGLAVPGMPPGSPGMETDGGAKQPFEVVAFDAQGYREVFASYP